MPSSERPCCRFPYQHARTSGGIKLNRNLLWLGLPILVGIVLRTLLLVKNQPLWLDEAYIANNVERLGYIALTGEILYGQSCPIGVLWAIKLVSGLVPGEIGLRLFPFVSGLTIVALLPLLFYRIAGTARAAIIGSWITSLSVPLVLYSAQVKQYETEALVTLIVLFVATRKEAHRAYFLIYPLLVLFSFAAPVLIAAEIAARAWKKQSWKILFYGLPSAIVLVLIYFFQIRYFAGRGELVEFWANGFPNPPYWSWAPRKFMELSAFATGSTNVPYIYYVVPGILAAAGAWLSPKPVRLFGILCLFFALALGALWIYPAEGRLSLYLLPVLILWIAMALVKPPKLVSIALCLILMIPMGVSAIGRIAFWDKYHYVFNNTALPVQDIRSLMYKASEVISQGESLHVHKSAMPQAEYYSNLLKSSVPLKEMGPSFSGWGLSAVDIPQAAMSDEVSSSGDAILFHTPKTN